MRLVRPLLLGLAACLACGIPARAARLKVDYLITLEGLTLGQAGFEGTFEEARYDMKLSGQLTGLVGAVSGSARGGAASRGTVASTRLSPAGFSASARSGDNERTIQVGVTGGNVTQVAINPPFEPQPTRVPLSEGSLRGITDPLSGMVAVAANPAKPDDPSNCNRTVPVFDGGQRFNIVLSYADKRLVRRPGYTGNVLVCSVRYVPLTGHRTDRESVRFMAENRDMQVWLAPVQGTRFLVPIRISVRTMMGTSVVEAQSWRVE